MVIYILYFRYNVVSVVSEQSDVRVELLFLWWLTFRHSVRTLFQNYFSLLFLTNAGNTLSLYQWFCMTRIHFMLVYNADIKNEVQTHFKIFRSKLYFNNVLLVSLPARSPFFFSFSIADLSSVLLSVCTLFILVTLGGRSVVSEQSDVRVELLFLWWLTFRHSVRTLFQNYFSLLFLTNAGNTLSLYQWFCMTRIHFMLVYNADIKNEVQTHFKIFRSKFYLNKCCVLDFQLEKVN